MKFTTVFVALVSAVPVVFGLTINTPYVFSLRSPSTRESAHRVVQSQCC